MGVGRWVWRGVCGEVCGEVGMGSGLRCAEVHVGVVRVFGEVGVVRCVCGGVSVGVWSGCEW